MSSTSARIEATIPTAFSITSSESLSTVLGERVRIRRPQAIGKRWYGIRKTDPELVIVAAETPQNVGGLRTIHQPRGAPFSTWPRPPGRAETLAGLAGVAPWNIEEAVVGAVM